MSLKFAADHTAQVGGTTAKYIFIGTAQRIFDAWLKEQPVVYGNKTYSKMENFNSYEEKSPTHTARLVCIEEIKREPCKHEPIVITENHYSPHSHWGHEKFEVKCKHCSCKLTATWSEVNE